MPIQSSPNKVQLVGPNLIVAEISAIDLCENVSNFCGHIAIYTRRARLVCWIGSDRIGLDKIELDKTGLYILLCCIWYAMRLASN